MVSLMDHLEREIGSQDIMKVTFSTGSTTPAISASTGVRWSTQQLILTSLWWGAMCSLYWLLRTTLNQHAHRQYRQWLIQHVLIYQFPLNLLLPLHWVHPATGNYQTVQQQVKMWRLVWWQCLLIIHQLMLLQVTMYKIILFRYVTLLLF